MDDSIQVNIDLKIIYSINFDRNHFAISSKNGMVIYNLDTLKVIYSESGAFWDAIFIPNTDYILYVKHDYSEKSKRQLTIFDFGRKKIISTITVKH